jgi:hypothetical protein
MLTVCNRNGNPDYLVACCWKDSDKNSGSRSGYNLNFLPCQLFISPVKAEFSLYTAPLPFGGLFLSFTVSSGLEDVTVNDFIKDDFIPEGDGQVASGSVSLSDPVVLETEEQMLEREQNERVVLESIDKTHVMVVTYCSKRHRSSLSLVVVNGITLMTEPY